MKFASILVLAIVANISFAAPIFCEGSNGYQLETSSNLKTAEITKNGQELQFGSLSCVVLTPRCPNCAPTLSCHTAEHVADAGYSASIKMQSPGTDMHGKIVENTFAGAREVSILKCVGAAE